MLCRSGQVVSNSRQIDCDKCDNRNGMDEKRRKERETNL